MANSIRVDFQRLSLSLLRVAATSKVGLFRADVLNQLNLEFQGVAIALSTYVSSGHYVTQFLNTEKHLKLPASKPKTVFTKSSELPYQEMLGTSPSGACHSIASDLGAGRLKLLTLPSDQISQVVVFALPLSKADGNLPVSTNSVIEVFLGTDFLGFAKELTAIAEILKSAFETALRRRIADVTTSINALSSEFHADNYLDRLAGRVREQLHCEGVTVFLERDGHLVDAGTTGFKWVTAPDEPQYYASREGITGTVWQDAKPRTIFGFDGMTGHQRKSTEIVASDARHSCVWYPLLAADTTIPLGVIRCRNKTMPNNSQVVPTFDESDIAILRGISTSATPHIQLLESNRVEKHKLARVSHELKLPLTTIRGAIGDISKSKLVPADTRVHLRILDSEFALMFLYLEHSDHFRRYPVKQRPNKRLTQFKKDIALPAKNDTIAVMTQYSLDENKIVLDHSLNSLPVIKADRSMLRLALMSLIINSIQFYSQHRKNPDGPLVEILAHDDSSKIVVTVRDYGEGFRPEESSEWFVPGRRGASSHEFKEVGQGLGLWFVRLIAELHGGTAWVKSKRHPTEVCISFPSPR